MSAVVVLCALGALLFPQRLRGGPRPDGQPSAALPDLQVEFLGCEKGFATGEQSVAMLCVIRNVGAAPLPENTARVRCYPLTGMDFMEGQLWPNLPALAPNQAVAFRWRVAVTDQVTPLVFSVLLSKADPPSANVAARTGGPQVQPTASDIPIPPRVVAVPIPRFPSTPHLLGAATAATTPYAIGGQATARVGNDRSMINVVADQDRIPLLAIAGKEGNDWKIVATVAPAVQIRSAEEGRIPGGKSFRWTSTDVHDSKDSAELTLQGAVGPNWSAHVVLELRANTGVIYGKLQLFARRPVRLYGIQLPRLLGVPAAGASPVRLDGTAAILNPDPSLLPPEEASRGSRWCANLRPYLAGRAAAERLALHANGRR